ncbi:DUF1292 domain-containing protein [Miniphocaeibacter massiliensis]|uniref:DUF1292 domain-containing protein n=1 Tax=Miniphocaeibacter massiliensis TaxID=2041841 RepID=UPI000C06AC1F|nr:DUF1292 domain-containing protein [Miniphocaeibacter massiliensis]
MSNNEHGCGCGENHDHNNNHENECGCGHDHEGEIDTIKLTLDDDSELECGILGVFEVPEQERDYIALITLEDEQVLLYRYIADEEDEEAFSLDSIESDEEFENVSNIFYETFVNEDEE